MVANRDLKAQRPGVGNGPRELLLPDSRSTLLPSPLSPTPARVPGGALGTFQEELLRSGPAPRGRGHPGYASHPRPQTLEGRKVSPAQTRCHDNPGGRGCSLRAWRPRVPAARAPRPRRRRRRKRRGYRPPRSPLPVRPEPAGPAGRQSQRGLRGAQDPGLSPRCPQLRSARGGVVERTRGCSGERGERASRTCQLDGPALRSAAVIPRRALSPQTLA